MCSEQNDGGDIRGGDDVGVSDTPARTHSPPLTKAPILMRLISQSNSSVFEKVISISLSERIWRFILCNIIGL